jgi:hypothetical protein
VGARLLLLGLQRPPWIWVTDIDVERAKKFAQKQVFTILHKIRAVSPQTIRA